MSALISGVARSGTSAIYQVLAKGYVDKFKEAKCVYEPYLRAFPATNDVDTGAFSTENIDLFNVAVHCKTPLFFAKRNNLHDHWLRKVYGPVSIKSKQAPENIIAKVSRGAGRLESALDLFENLKVVIVVRNVIDTVNSGLGLMSFFGDEFHPSDKKRFIDEVNENFCANLNFNDIKTELEWSTLWWHYFTQVSFDLCQKYKGRVLLVPYERYVSNKLAVMQEVFDFAGVERKFINQPLLHKETGPTTSIAYLTESERGKLQPEMDWYFLRLSELIPTEINKETFESNLNQKFKRRRYFKSPLYMMPANYSAVQLRMQVRDTMQQESIAKPSFHIKAVFDVTSIMAKFGSDSKVVANLSKKYSLKEQKRIGVVITCYNNENSIAASIYSVLAQTRRPDVICIADDCSNDNSIKIIEDLAAKFPCVKLIKRHANVGVSANRDLAIRSLDVDYISTLDGDDLYAPYKIESEELALNGNLSGIAFSDIVVVSLQNSDLQVTAPYHQQKNEVLLTMLLSRSAPVPRDLLFSKDLFIKSGGFDVGMHLYEDWALKMRLFATANHVKVVYTGCKGTIYDRREPGLSNKKGIDHAYGQLQAIARNASLFKNNNKALSGGFTTVSRPFSGELLKLSKAYNDNKFNYEQVIKRLEAFWAGTSFKDSPEIKNKRLLEFFSK